MSDGGKKMLAQKFFTIRNETKFLIVPCLYSIFFIFPLTLVSNYRFWLIQIQFFRFILFHRTDFILNWCLSQYIIQSCQTQPMHFHAHTSGSIVPMYVLLESEGSKVFCICFLMSPTLLVSSKSNVE